MSENEIIGRNLKTLREANNYTQEQVAAFFGIQRSAYANYESGMRDMPIKILENASSLFGCDLELFFDEDENAVKNMLVCAFRADNLCADDLKEVAAFKDIVMSYMKMDKILAQ